MTALTDEQLMEQLLQGHTSALGELYRRHARTLYAFCRNLIPASRDAEDMVQDVFLRDRLAGTTERLNLSLTGGELNDDSWVPQMTPDLRVITYTSEATNIVTGNTNGERQIFATDLRPEVGSNYCNAAPNSTGVAGALSATGSSFASANSVTLEASSLPRNQFGIFLTSQTQGFTPMPPGSVGNLCLGGSIGRYVGPGQILSSGAGGAFSLVLDLTTVPQGAGFVAVQPGESWNFQAWHRDLVAGVPTSNFTDGLAIDFD